MFHRVHRAHRAHTDHQYGPDPKGTKNWPVLVLMYDSESDYCNIFGISLRNYRIWVRSPAKKSKHDAIAGYQRAAS